MLISLLFLTIHAQYSPDFGFHLANEILPPGSNSCFSPLSISACFALVYPAAVGDTARELQKGLGFSPSATETFAAYADLGLEYDALSSGDASWNSIPPQLVLSNRLYISDSPSFHLDPEYSTLVQDLAVQLDFRSGQAASEVNRYVSKKTKGLIKHTVDSVDPDTTVLAVNTLFFNASWATLFEEWNTKPASFFESAAHATPKPHQAHLMKATDRFYYLEDDARQLVKLPFSRCEVSMFIDLPKQESAFLDAEQLTFAGFQRILENLEERRMDLFLPKFKFESTFSDSLKQGLQNLGVKTAFTPGVAEFPGLDPTGKSAAIDEIVHKTVIDVNEKGTTAAAVTAMTFKAMSMPVFQPDPTEFRADHPFTFYIYDERNKVMLFMGHVLDPTDATLQLSSLHNSNSSVSMLEEPELNEAELVRDFTEGFIFLGCSAAIISLGFLITQLQRCLCPVKRKSKRAVSKYRMPTSTKLERIEPLIV